MLPERRLPMRKTHEILRLHFESHLVPRQIASICKISRSTVQRCLERLRAAGLCWPLPADVDDAALERRLHAPYTKGNFQFERTVKGWRTGYVVLDLRLKG